MYLKMQFFLHWTVWVNLTKIYNAQKLSKLVKAKNIQFILNELIYRVVGF